MAEGKLQIRLKTKNGHYTIDMLTGADTVGKLKSSIRNLTKMSPDRCRLMMGYPPEEIFLVDDDQRINEIFKNPREMLIIDEQGSGSDSVGRGGRTNHLFDDENHKKMMQELSAPRRRMDRIEVPANNSCLFVSVYFCLVGQMQEKCPELRNLIAETVRADPETYNEGFLGKPNDEYCSWIRNEDHWGGGIELSILSNYYQVEIVAVDTQNTRLNRFGEDQCYPQRIFLIFDGIHYDPLVVHSNDEHNPIQTSFSSDDQEAVDMALELARQAKANHQYTDLKRMLLKCNQCKQSFGQNEAREHASATGHTDFSEMK